MKIVQAYHKVALRRVLVVFIALGGLIIMWAIGAPPFEKKILVTLLMVGVLLLVMLALMVAAIVSTNSFNHIVDAVIGESADSLYEAYRCGFSFNNTTLAERYLLCFDGRSPQVVDVRNVSTAAFRLRPHPILRLPCHCLVLQTRDGKSYAFSLSGRDFKVRGDKILGQLKNVNPGIVFDT